MKTKLSASVLIVALATSVFTALPAHSQSVHRENGWYRVEGGSPDSLSHEPIVTVKEFIELRLMTDGAGKSVITGQISRHKQQAWANATEAAIGKRIAFVFNDSIVSEPQVNQRIESGSFQISTPPGRDFDLPAMYRQLREEKKDSIDALFRDWETDRTLTLRQQDSLKMRLDYWEAKAWLDLTKAEKPR